MDRRCPIHWWIQVDGGRSKKLERYSMRSGLGIPEELHDAHNEYPLAAMRIVTGRVEKLVFNLNNKTKYVVNHRTLKCYFDKNTIFCENLIAVHMKKARLKLDKPIYLGASILDISKTFMYDFHYDYVMKNYGPRSKLLFTDTDSLYYQIEMEDFYRDISGDMETFQHK